MVGFCRFIPYMMRCAGLSLKLGYIGSCAEQQGGLEEVLRKSSALFTIGENLIIESTTNMAIETISKKYFKTMKLLSYYMGEAVKQTVIKL